MVKKAGDISEKIGEIRYNGPFDYEHLYLAMYEWLKNHYYDVSETYKHKMTPTGAEVELTIKADRKESEFVRYYAEIETHFWDIVDTETIVAGKKQKLNKGRFTIIIRMKVKLDYQSQFDKSELLIRLYNMLYHTILKDRILIMWAGKLFLELLKLHTKIKEELGLYTAYSAY